jgi:hypothetical protein
MLQHIKMIISIAKGTCKDLLICRVALSGLRHVGTFTPNMQASIFSKMTSQKQVPELLLFLQ